MSKQSVSYYLFSVSNLLAAFGGGLILGKGVGVIDSPLLEGGSILAFFVGTVIGLLLLQCVPKKWSVHFARSLSFSGGIFSFILLFIYQQHAISFKIAGAVAWIFFLMFCIRFSFWFYSRVLRASIAAKQEHSIAWVELGYYSGMVLGLLVWKLSKIDITFDMALILDGALQMVAGLIDFKTISVFNAVAESPANHENVEFSSANRSWCWKLSLAVVFLTLAIQVIIFNAAHSLPETISPLILAIFYVGVAAAALFCSQYKLKLDWFDTVSRQSIALIYSEKNGTSLQLRLSLLVFIAMIAVLGGMLLIYQLDDAMITLNVGILVFIAAFIYEVLSISLLDRLGLEEKQLRFSGDMLIKTYGLMGISAAVGFWLLSLVNHQITISLMIICLSVCISLILVSRRQDKLLLNF